MSKQQLDSRRDRMHAFLKGVIGSAPYLQETSTQEEIGKVTSVRHLLIKALKSKIELLPDLTTKLYVTLAFFHIIKNQNTIAIEAINKLERLARASFKPGELANAYIEVGNIFRLTRQNIQALEYYKTAHNICCEKIGRNTLFSIRILDYIAVGYRQLGLLDELLNCLREIHGIYLSIEGEKSVEAYKLYLSKILPLEIDRFTYEDPLKFMGELVDQCVDIFGENHECTLAARLALVKGLKRSNFFENPHRIGEIEYQLQSSYSISVSLYGEISIETGTLLNTISSAYLLLASITRKKLYGLFAEDYALRSTRVLQKAYPDGDKLLLAHLAPQLHELYGTAFLNTMESKAREFLPEIEAVIEKTDFSESSPRLASAQCFYLAAFYRYRSVKDLVKSEHYYLKAIEQIDRSIDVEILSEKDYILGELSTFYFRFLEDFDKGIELGFDSVELKKQLIEETKLKIERSTDYNTRMHWKAKLRDLYSDLRSRCFGICHLLYNHDKYELAFQEFDKLKTEYQDMYDLLKKQLIEEYERARES